MHRPGTAFTIFISILVSALHSQVYKTVVVEHFTNTHCSVCASRNPGFYTNLSNHPEILHVAFHPSSPYPQCPLNQQNKSENDERTNFYGVYGGTPRLVIQGDVIPGTSNYSDPLMFAPYLNKPAAVTIGINQAEVNDSLRVNLWVKRISAAQLPDSALVYVALVSDTLAFTGANGEPLQHDVFRKLLTKPAGTFILLPPTIGSTVTVNLMAPLNSAWNKKSLYTLALVQNETTKEVLNAFATAPGEGLISNIQRIERSLPNLTCFPNPFTDHLTFQNASQGLLSVDVYDLMGTLLTNEKIATDSRLLLNDLPSGPYLIRVTAGEKRYSFLRVKE